MKIFLILFLVGSFGFARTSVRGYYRSNGTYVEPHSRSSPDKSIYNNYSTYGNSNPYSGKPGRKYSYGSTYGSFYSTSSNNFEAKLKSYKISTSLSGK